MKNIKNLIGFLTLIALFLIVPKSVSAQVYGCDYCGGSQNTYDYSYISPTIYTNTSTVQTQQPYQQQQTQTAGNYYGNQYGYGSGYQNQQQYDYSYTAPTIYTPNTPRPEPYQPYTVILPTQYVSSGPAYAQPQIISSNNPNPTSTTSFSNPFTTHNTYGSGSSQNDQVSEDVLKEVESRGLGIGTTTAGLCINDTVEYVIIYKNITKSTITNAAVKVSLADGIKFKTASSGIYSESDNSVTTFIGTLSVGQEGRIYITGVNTTLTTSQKVTRAEFVYTLPDQTQNMVVSYVFHGDGSCRQSPLAGFAAGAGGFFPTTLAGWILLTLLICAIIYLTRYFMRKEDTHDVHARAH